MNIVKLFEEQANKLGQHIAIWHGDNSISFQQLAEQSGKGRKYLVKLGLQPGDVVLVFVPMSIDLYVILLSLWRHGLTAMFLDPSAGRKTIEKCCQAVQPKAFIGTSRAQMLRVFIPSLWKIPVVLSTGFAPFCRKWSEREFYRPERSYLQCDAKTPALITFTSGSTGFPKGTVRTHGFLFAQYRVLRQTLVLKPGNADLATLPVFALSNLAAGVTTIIPSVNLMSPGTIDPEAVLADLKRHRPQTAVASPAFFARLLSHKKNHELSCLKTLFTGGAPVFPSLLRKLQAQISGCRIVAVYGSTEAEPIAEISFSEITEQDFGKMATGGGLLAGQVVDAIDCRIIKNSWGTSLVPMTSEQFDAVRLPTNSPGEIVVQGEHVLQGYLSGIGDQENKFSVDGVIWHRTGDLGYFDDSGRLWLLGRCSAKVEDRFGELFPFAVETAAMQINEVERSALCLVKNKRILVIDTLLSSGQVTAKLNDIIERFKIEQVLVQKIPVDKRHNAKVDYPALLKSIKIG